jgi:hypothetical protein
VDDVRHVEVDARGLDPALKARILDLRRRCFPEHRGTPAELAGYWDWKFAARDSSIWLACAQAREELLGFYSCLSLAYLSPAGPLKVGIVVDVMTAPEARGRGVFTALGHTATLGMLGERGYELLTGYPVRETVLPGHRSVGWSFCERMPVYAVPVFQPLGWMVAVWSRARGYCVEEFTPSNRSQAPGVAMFQEEWERQAVADRLMFLRLDDVFDGWRYSTPGAQYRGLLVRDRQGRVLGYVTYRSMRLRGLTCLAIADVKVVRPSAFRALVGAMLARAPFGTALVAGMFSRAVARRTRPARAFMLKSPFLFQLILKGTGRGVPVIESCGNDGCYLTWLDTDDV